MFNLPGTLVPNTTIFGRPSRFLIFGRILDPGCQQRWWSRGMWPAYLLPSARTGRTTWNINETGKTNLHPRALAFYGGDCEN
jgi:hypothetical protein